MNAHQIADPMNRWYFHLKRWGLCFHVGASGLIFSLYRVEDSPLGLLGTAVLLGLTAMAVCSTWRGTRIWT